MIIIKIILTVMIDMILIYLGVQFISTRDDADGEIVLSKKGYTVSYVWCMIFTLMNILLNNVDIHRYIIFNIILIYNTIMSYTDIQSKMVWPIISYISALIAIVNLIVSNLLSKIDLVLTLKYSFIALIVIILFKIVRAFGDGDLKIIFVNYLFILPFYKEITPIVSLITLLMVMIPFILINFKKIKGGKMREAVAFAPYLMASMFITMFV